LCSLHLFGQDASSIDSDHDGLRDQLENKLLDQFAPQFMVSREDCSLKPARFVPLRSQPIVEAEDGTIYGQAFIPKEQTARIELHYYHLWRTDCGEMGHNLDAEHVSVLLGYDQKAEEWKALYWYTAAHEDTVCDASQIAHADTVGAVDRGARIWISAGKHASFLSEVICTHGCGGDRCPGMAALKVDSVINLGELSAPMNGAVWQSSNAWPLATKLMRSDFSLVREARVERLPDTDILWANPAKRPVQAVILGGNDALGGAATGLRATNTALAVTNTNTGAALGTGATQTGNKLSKSYRGVKKALQKAATKTGEAIGGEPQR
jgi:hypothetical protein